MGRNKEHKSNLPQEVNRVCILRDCVERSIWSTAEYHGLENPKEYSISLINFQIITQGTPSDGSFNEGSLSCFFIGSPLTVYNLKNAYVLRNIQRGFDELSIPGVRTSPIYVGEIEHQGRYKGLIRLDFFDNQAEYCFPNIEADEDSILLIEVDPGVIVGTAFHVFDKKVVSLFDPQTRYLKSEDQIISLYTSPDKQEVKVSSPDPKKQVVDHPNILKFPPPKDKYDNETDINYILRRLKSIKPRRFDNGSPKIEGFIKPWGTVVTIQRFAGDRREWDYPHQKWLYYPGQSLFTIGPIQLPPESTDQNENIVKIANMVKPLNENKPFGRVCFSITDDNPKLNAWIERHTGSGIGANAYSKDKTINPLFATHENLASLIGQAEFLPPIEQPKKHIEQKHPQRRW